MKKQVSQVQVCLLRLRAQSGWRRYSCSDLYSFAFGHSVNGLMFVCVCVIPLIDASIPRTQFPIVHVNVAVVLYPSVCVFETIRLKVLFFFFLDQTLLTPRVDNLGNSSSSIQLEPHIARGGVFWWTRWCLCVCVFCVHPFRGGELLFCILVVSFHSSPSQEQ